MLRRFPGYTLSGLLNEDAGLVRLLAIEARGRREVDDGGE